MKLEVNVPSEVEERLNDKCKKTQKEPSELVELLLEWYFLKRKKPEINEIGNASDFLKIADYCAKERLYSCKYSDIDNCTRDVEVHGSKKPKPLHPYMCLFCSQFQDKREQDKTHQEEDKEENDTRNEINTETRAETKAEDFSGDMSQNVVDEHKIARIAAGIVMEQYGNELTAGSGSTSETSKTNTNSDEETSKELSFDDFEEEMGEGTENDLEEKELITRDKVEKLLEDW